RARRDCRGAQRLIIAGGGIGFRFVSSWLHCETSCSRLNIASHCCAACDTLRAVFIATHDILLEECLIDRGVCYNPGQSCRLPGFTTAEPHSFLSGGRWPALSSRGFLMLLQLVKI